MNDAPAFDMRKFRPQFLIPRFSLRSLFLLVAAAAIAFAGWSRYVGPYREELRLSRELAGGGKRCAITYVPADEVPQWLRQWLPNWFRHVRRIQIGSGAGELEKLKEELVIIRGFRQLKEVEAWIFVDQESLRLISELDQIEWARFSLSSTPGDSMDWSVLGRLSNLRELHLLDLPCNDDDLCFLSEFAALQVLGVGGSPVSGSFLEWLPANSKLTTLGLDFVKLGDISDGIAHLTQLKTLRLSRVTLSQFNLENTPAGKSLEKLDLVEVTLSEDVGLSLIQLPHMRELRFVSTLITDPIVESLLKSPTIESIELNMNLVSPTIAKKLRKHIKNVYYVPSPGFQGDGI